MLVPLNFSDACLTTKKARNLLGLRACLNSRGGTRTRDRDYYILLCWTAQSLRCFAFVALHDCE